MNANAFEHALQTNGIAPLKRTTTHTLQINLGKRCNQACRHCHVGAGPNRPEMMSAKTINRVLALLDASPTIETVDITGGAPELHPQFRSLVERVSNQGSRIIDRCNLTVLSLPDQEDTAEFLARHRVEVIASLPCYSTENVDKQRGNGVFEQSITGLKMLNDLGYGRPNSGLTLNLVYNPIGAHLPPEQSALEVAYKEKLNTDHGIEFNRLFTITNMPIARFKNDLVRSGALNSYINLLAANFNPDAVGSVMCKELISVSYEGLLFDCDFNQMLNLKHPESPISVWDIDSFQALAGHRIATGAHCLGCTAGSGSSCSGALQ